MKHSKTLYIFLSALLLLLAGCDISSESEGIYSQIAKHVETS